ncbi:hypothetical protein MMC24_000841 [Lignoscripta atroalba]|nr:hypothetical protein [Lignoscripta atroalba]
MASSTGFLDAVKARRTFYQISNESTISDDRIEEIVKHAVLHVPSSFNSQSSRLVVLLKKEHEKLWDITKEILRTQVPDEESFKNHTEPRINGFRAGYGTVLFFEDPEPIKQLQSNLPIYADKFPQWSEHTSAMHQYMIWTAFTAEGMGCNLQHYNPLIDQRVRTEWNINTEWNLKAQLVFGKPTGQPGEKQFQALEERLMVYGK